MTSPTDTRRVRLGLESLSERIVPATHFRAVAQDIGGTSLVKVYNEDGNLARTIAPYGSNFTGGARVATGDVTGDGIDDIVIATGPGGGPELKVYDGATGNVVRDFFAYEPSFRGGVNVAAGDVNSDGKADIVTGTGTGGGPNVRVFDGTTGDLLDSFFAYEDSFRGGVNVAAGDVTGDGKAEVVTGTGFGGGPRVQVFDALTAAEVGNFFAYDASVRGGVTVGAGDLTGDGKAEVVTGTGPGGGPNVKVYDGATGNVNASFYAYDAAFVGGVSVAVVHANGANEVMVAPGPGPNGYVELFDGNGVGIDRFLPFPGFWGGVATGQGVATADAPFGKVFAMPVVLTSPGGGGGTPADDGNGGDVFGNGDSGYVPPIDTGYIPPIDTSVTSTDPGTTSTDTGSVASSVPWYLDPYYDYPWYYGPGYGGYWDPVDPVPGA
ncbi:MAG TPA: VCBS repeat-containing protein [Gemmataceae bacterium]|nr:VCBS repeat-containing protein [Gemmataceae bacterium]